MIIQCENCARKFQVKDEDIPKEGRMVQCSNCSQTWFQASVKIRSSIIPDTDKEISKIERKKSKTIETKNDSVDKNGVLSPNKQVKSNKSKILVLDQMIE